MASVGGTHTLGLPRETAAASRLLFLAMVAVLPVHTIFLRAWISWKPWLIVLAVVAGLHTLEGARARKWPWNPMLSIASGAFLVAAAASWSGGAGERYVRLLLALVVGVLVMLVTERELNASGMLGRVLRVVYWSAAAMAITVVPLAIMSTGLFGAAPLDAINDLPLVENVAKNVYLDEGMVAVTNWHIDPGYAAMWANLWAALAFLAAQRGLGSGRRMVDAAVIGSLWLGILLTYSRTGVAGMVIVIAIVLWHEHRKGRLRDALRLASRGALITVLLVAFLLLIDPSGEGGDLSRGFSFRIGQGLSLGEVPADAPASALFDNRREVWAMYIDFFRADPLRGIGLGTGWANTIQEPHSLVLELLGEMGLVGLAGFAVLGAAIVRLRRNDVGTVALVIALVPAITQTVLFEPAWWFAAGIAVGAPSLAASQIQDETGGLPWMPTATS